MQCIHSTVGLYIHMYLIQLFHINSWRPCNESLENNRQNFIQWSFALKLCIKNVKSIFHQYLLYVNNWGFFSVGCPNATFYGESCKLPCPTSCKNRRCHIETGYCFGCEYGYLGSTCNLRKYCRLTSKIRSRA